MTDSHDAPPSTIAPRKSRRTKIPRRSSSTAPAEYHAVRFYDSDQSLARIVAEFLADGLRQGHPGLVVATADQRAEIVRELTDRSFDVPALEGSRDLALVDAVETLSAFMIDGKPDAERFTDEMCRLIRTLRRDAAGVVRVFGQMVDVLWQRGEREAAIRLEVLWNQLAQTEAFSLVCGYAIGSFYKDAGFDEVCRQHSHVIAADGTAHPLASAASDTSRRGRKRRGG